MINESTAFAVPRPKAPRERFPSDPSAAVDLSEKKMAWNLARIDREPIPENESLYRYENMFVKDELEPLDLSRLDDEDEDQVQEYLHNYTTKFTLALREANKRRGIKEDS